MFAPPCKYCICEKCQRNKIDDDCCFTHTELMCGSSECPDFQPLEGQNAEA